jgi:hypothetical protein
MYNPAIEPQTGRGYSSRERSSREIEGAPMNRFTFGALAAALLFAFAARAEIKPVVDHNDNEHAKPEFKFEHVPSPSKDDAATKAKFSIVEGERDPAGADLDALNDGKLPTEEDQPAANFYFNAGTEGGRLLLDLGDAIDVKQVNTYSWHPNTRGPQLYKLYASDGKGDGFKSDPKKDTDPATVGWKLIATIDTRPKQGDAGGQYAVSIADDKAASLGKYRYFLFDCKRTEADDDFGNTFYSEIDVIAAAAPGAKPQAAAPVTELVEIDGGKYRCTIDTTETPDLTEWAHTELVPVVKEWYPKIVEMLPSEGFEAPKVFSITFRKENRAIADTRNTRINCQAEWIRKNLKGEARGAIVHEMVHVVQQYWSPGRRPNANRNPGWLVEGLCDYIRWYKYEPQTHGADINARRLSRANYDGSYRVTGNFLNWVTDHYDKTLVRDLNAAMREGKYTDDIWKKLTGKTADELNTEWKADLSRAVGAADPNAAVPAGATGGLPVSARPVALSAAPNPDESSPNTLTDDEKKSGYKLLFDGKSLDGWHTFKRHDVKPGWQMKDGTIACVDPHNAGDLCTNEQYGWFELQLDYNISEGGNSGIMYHVTDKGGAAWATGPEFQLEDNAKAADPIRSGWLYALYQPPTDPATGKPLDATKPAGQWNHVRLLISPDKCEHEINGVKYFEYVLGSDDFKQRVAKSKFSKMPDFAKFDAGYIALQGDHGQVSFRNVKVRVIEPEKKN